MRSLTPALALCLLCTAVAHGAEAVPDSSLTQTHASAAVDSATRVPSAGPAAAPTARDSALSAAAHDSSSAEAARDSVRMPAHARVVAPAAAAAAPTLPPAATPPPGAPRRGVADTVTMLPPVHVNQTRSTLPERTTATTVRLERSGVVRFLPSNVNDALATVPGVELVKMGPWASRVSLRGLTGDRVLVMVDGVRLNTARGHGGQSSLVSVDQLDAVELMPGATSAQYGSDAIGGVINLVTHRNLFGSQPAMDFTVSARGSEPGDGNAQQVHARIRSERWGIEAGAGMGGLDALVTPQGKMPNSGYREDNYSVRGALQLGPAVVDYEHTLQAAHDIGLPVFNGGFGFALTTGTAGSYPLQSRDADRLELSLPQAGARPEARLLGVVQTQRTYFTETSTDSTVFGGRLVRTSMNEAKDRVTTHSAGLQPLLRFQGLGGLRLSGEYRDETAGGPRVTDHNPVTYPLGGPPQPQPTLSSVGESVPPATRLVWSGSAFVSPQLAGVKLETGARYDWVRSHADSTALSTTHPRDVTDDHWSGEAGLSRSIAGVEPYVHAATGFRVPNLDERYYNDDIHGGMRLYGNENLLPETSRSYEVGVRATDRLADWLPEARVSVYRSDVENLISFKYVTTVNLVPRFQYFNLQNARIEGVEFQSRVRLPGAGLALSAGFPRGTDVATGKHLLDVGAGRVTMDLTVPVARLLPMGQVAARARWGDAVLAQDPQDAVFARPAFWVASVEASGVFGGVRAVFAVRNLFNAYYFEPLSFIPEAGRTYAVSLRKDFSVPLGSGRKGS